MSSLLSLVPQSGTHAPPLNHLPTTHTTTRPSLFVNMPLSAEDESKLLDVFCSFCGADAEKGQVCPLTFMRVCRVHANPTILRERILGSAEETTEIV